MKTRGIIVLLFVMIMRMAAAHAAPQVSLPADEKPHPKEPVEWWYYSGHLEDDAGRSYGVMASFFIARMGNMPPSHFMIYQLVEKDAKQFHSGSVIQKEMVTLMRMTFDALPPEYKAMLPEGYLSDESIAKHHRFIEGKPIAKPDRLALKYGGQIFKKSEGDGETDWSRWAYETTLDDEAFHLELAMRPERGPMYVGGEGNVGMHQDEAMYYYSLTRLASSGTLTIGGEARAVHGTIWYDHQFGSMGKEIRPIGWDWFCLQLADGTDLNLSALRHPETGERFSRLATVQFADGSQTVTHDLVIEALGEWTSPDTGFTYPSGWVLAVPSLGMRFTVRPEFPRQEMRTFGPMQAIWEGACTVEAEVNGKPVAGLGYTELVGYNVPRQNAELKSDAR